MSNGESPITGFEAVDVNKNAPEFVTYLRRVSALGPIRKYKRRVDEMLNVHSGDIVLDVGCGIGLDVEELANSNNNARFVGIDNSVVMLNQARLLKSNSLLQSDRVTFRQDDVVHLSFEDNVFEAVRADRVFQHLESPQQALREIVRVIKPGGKIVVADTDWNSLKIDGIPNEDSEVVRRAFLGFIKSPLIASNLKNLFLEEKIERDNITQEKMKLEFTGLQDSDLILWLSASLELGEKVGAITENERRHVLQKIQTADPDAVRTSFDFYITAGIKS